MAVVWAVVLGFLLWAGIMAPLWVLLSIGTATGDDIDTSTTADEGSGQRP